MVSDQSVTGHSCGLQVGVLTKAWPRWNGGGGENGLGQHTWGPAHLQRRIQGRCRARGAGLKGVRKGGHRQQTWTLSWEKGVRWLCRCLGSPTGVKDSTPEWDGPVRGGGAAQAHPFPAVNLGQDPSHL